MKYCPHCEKRYADETLVFCLDDGAALNAKPGPPKQSAVDTVALKHPVTAEKAAQTDEMIVDLEKHWEKTRGQQVRRPISPPKIDKGKSHLLRWQIIAPALFLLLAASATAAIYLYFPLGNAKDQITSFDNAKRPAEANPDVSSARIEAAKTPDAKQSPSPLNPDDLKKEIADNINTWSALAEARDVNSYVAKYADTVDYYDKNDINITEVRNAVQKLFSRYSDIEIALTNIRVAVDGGGNKATAIFDKEWTYENDKDLAHGKDHIKLQLQRTGGDWKIFSEKIRKNYYTHS